MIFIRVLKQTKYPKTRVTFNKPWEEVISFISDFMTQDKLDSLTWNTKVPFNTLFSQYEKEVLDLAKEKWRFRKRRIYRK